MHFFLTLWRILGGRTSLEYQKHKDVETVFITPWTSSAKNTKLNGTLHLSRNSQINKCSSSL